MRCQSVFFALLFTIILALPYLNAETSIPVTSSHSPIVKERAIPALGVVEMELANGIRVCLKPTNFDEDEILIHGFAPGGYALVDPAKRASAQLAAAIAWESGVGTFSAQQLSQKLYDSEMELATYIGPHSHSIEAIAPPEKFSDMLRIIGGIFTTPHFSPEALPTIISRMQESARHHSDDAQTQFEDTLKAINSGDLATLRPLSAEEIRAVDFRTSETFYREHFLNPNGLTFVIVGDFAIESVKPLVAQFLGGIPATGTSSNEAIPPLNPLFPQEVMRRHVPLKRSSDTLACITFSLSSAKVPLNIRLWETATQVIETRLRQAFIAEMGSTLGIDVALELPLHPCTVPIWLTLQFRCAPAQVEQLTRIILHELNKLQSTGPTQADIETACKLQECNDLFWEGDNSYWLALLSNHYQLGLNRDPLTSDHTADQISAFFSQALDLTTYTIVTLGH